LVNAASIRSNRPAICRTRSAVDANPAITSRLYTGEFEAAKRRDVLREKIAASGLGALLA
jgi:hypothetical protein